jgi:hypothetical protein
MRLTDLWIDKSRNSCVREGPVDGPLSDTDSLALYAQLTRSALP